MELFQTLESLAVILAAIVAIYGINSWRREMRGRKEYQLGEEVLALFYEAKDKISAIRSPLAAVGEGQSRKAHSNEKPEEKEAFDRAFIVKERYQKNQELFNRLYALRYRFIAIFGGGKAKPFDDLANIIKEILIAAQMLGFYWAHLSQTHLPRSEEKINKLIKERQKYEAVIWAGFEPDPIAPKVDEVISEIEKICEPILRRDSGVLNKIFNKFSKKNNNACGSQRL